MEGIKLVKIPEQWGLNVLDVKELTSTVYLLTTEESKYIIKKKNNFENAQLEANLLEELKEKQHIKVQMPVASTTGEFVFEYDQDYYMIYEYLEGDIIQAENGLENPRIPNSLGETIALLHNCLLNSSSEEKFPNRDLYQTVYEWAIQEFMKVDEGTRLKKIYDSIEEDIRKLSLELPKQLIHRDTHVTNFVFAGEEVSGVLDFEIMEVNVRIFDLCYCSTSVLSEVFNEVILKVKWFEFIAHLIKGYSKYNPLSDFETKSMWHVMLCIQSIFMAFFTKDENLFNANKEMFLWIYENRETIEEVLRKK